MSAPRTTRFMLNGSAVEVTVPPHLSLIDVLREHFDLFGARESCGQGLCGCCTVLVNGNAVSGCLYLAAFVDGASVTTVEWAADKAALDAVQEAFIESGAFQCGFCTPGFVLMTRQLLDANSNPSDD